MDFIKKASVALLVILGCLTGYAGNTKPTCTTYFAWQVTYSGILVETKENLSMTALMYIGAARQHGDVYDIPPSPFAGYVFMRFGQGATDYEWVCDAVSDQEIFDVDFDVRLKRFWPEGKTKNEKFVFALAPGYSFPTATVVTIKDSNENVIASLDGSVTSVELPCTVAKTATTYTVSIKRQIAKYEDVVLTHTLKNGWNMIGVSTHRLSAMTVESGELLNDKMLTVWTTGTYPHKVTSMSDFISGTSYWVHSRYLKNMTLTMTGQNKMGEILPALPADLSSGWNPVAVIGGADMSVDVPGYTWDNSGHCFVQRSFFDVTEGFWFKKE